MIQSTFDLLAAINCEGFDNSKWGFVQDVESKDWFGGDKNYHLTGKYVYVYLEYDEALSFVKAEPDFVIDNDECECQILIFEI